MLFQRMPIGVSARPAALLLVVLLLGMAVACTQAQPSPTVEPTTQAPATQAMEPTSTPLPATNPEPTATPKPLESLAFLNDGHVVLASWGGTVRQAVGSGLWSGAPTWSPDRSRLAYVVVYPVEARGTYVWQTDGAAQPTRVAPYGLLANPPAWSPDGTRLAIRQKAGPEQGIWVVGADGTGLTRILGTKENVSDLAWSPDGATIAFSYNPSPSSGGVYVMNTSGDSPKLLSPLLRAGHLTWSPEGTHIAVRSMNAEGSRVVSKVKGTGTLHVIDVASGAITQVASGLSGDPWQPVWANPHTIAVVLEGEGGQALAVVSRDGGEIALLARGALIRDLAWTTDGAAILSSMATSEGRALFRVTLQDIGMTWAMDMNMTRNMQPDAVQVWRNGRFVAWEPEGASALPPPSTPTGVPTSGVRIAQLLFDKYT